MMSLNELIPTLREKGKDIGIIFLKFVWESLTEVDRKRYLSEFREVMVDYLKETITRYTVPGDSYSQKEKSIERRKIDEMLRKEIDEGLSELGLDKMNWKSFFDRVVDE